MSVSRVAVVVCAGLTLGQQVSLPFANPVFAEPPGLSYVFPAGAQRGTAVRLRVGGFYLHEGAAFSSTGDGLSVSPRIERTETIWFEGPVIPQPASQRGEDYPVDYLGTASVSPATAPGIRSLRARTAQGLTESLSFAIGLLPEVTEQEIDGVAIPVPVTLPVTINGRVFPREDVDSWTFEAEQGATITCSVDAARLGSPLDARIEVRGPEGRRIADNAGHGGNDPFLRFEVAQSGTHTVLIHDVGYGGLQHYVYRLTLTDGPFIDAVHPRGGQAGSHVEFQPQGANLRDARIRLELPQSDANVITWNPDEAAATCAGIPLELTRYAAVIEEALPVDRRLPEDLSAGLVIDGRLLVPGELDSYLLTVSDQQPVQIETHAASLGSRLDSVLSIFDDTGKRLATSDDAGGSTDSTLKFKPPAAGVYRVEVASRIGSDAGPDCFYRLHLLPATSAGTQDAPPFAVTLPAEIWNLDRGAELKFRVDVQRFGFNDPIELRFEGLPTGVTASGTTLGKGKTRANVILAAAPDAKLGQAAVRLVGVSTVGEDVKKVVARRAGNLGQVDLDRATLSVNVPTPFKFTGIFESKFAPRGTVHRRHYALDRGGFEGPIEISLADRQVRHLQGVTGPKIIIPPGETEFDYPVRLPTFLQVGRTSRTCLMAVGTVQLEDGSQAKVTYTSTAQNDQIIVLTAPEVLSLKSPRDSVAAISGTSVELPIQLERTLSLRNDARIELLCPEHIRGVSMVPVELPSSQTQATVTLDFGTPCPGPFNMPLTLRATTSDDEGRPVIADCEIHIVSRGN